MNTKSIFSLAILLVVFGSCKKDTTSFVSEEIKPVTNTASIVSPVAPPTQATDSTMLMGNPSSATQNIVDASNYLLKEGYYSVSYNNDLGRPNWVSWHVSSTDYGAVSRQEDFRANPNLPSSYYPVTPSSFTPYVFDKGHMCPSADRTSSVEANSSTFLMTNIVAQAPNNNQRTWANLENYCRDTLVKKMGNELYIISGTLGEGGVGNNNILTNTIDNGRVSVPAYVWKVIVVIPNGSNDLTRVNNFTRVISVLMPNDNSIASNWRSYRVRVDDIEQQTSYDLLSKLSTSIQNVIEARLDNL